MFSFLKVKIPVVLFSSEYFFLPVLMKNLNSNCINNEINKSLVKVLESFIVCLHI